LTVPVSTYRLQLNRDLGFARARTLVGYLAELGIGACYLSPLLEATPGSNHGYDVVDHGRINPELGTEAELVAFAGDLSSRGMGVILDVVPNHMCVAGSRNRWWLDVLENGPSSP
jgi:(1->4)-alpha-D-glucan 1-alpha-D-glucosylmutase